MVIYLAGEIDEELGLDEMTPRQIVAELDKHVVGQRKAKESCSCRPAQSYSTPKTSTRDGGGCHAEEHNNDRVHGYWEN